MFPQEPSPINIQNLNTSQDIFQAKIHAKGINQVLGLTSLSDNQTSYKTLSEIQQAIATNFKRIHKIIDKFDSQLLSRFRIYQKQLLAVVKQEIQQMNSETRRLVNDLQQKIMQKEGNQLIWYFRNQSDFFKHQALKLFQTNKQLRLQIKLLKKSINEYQNRFEINDLLLSKLKKKQLKQKTKISRRISNNKINHSNFTQSMQKDQIPFRILKTRQRLQTQASKRIKTQQSNRINIIEPVRNTQNHDDLVQIVRYKTQVDREKLLGTHIHLLGKNQFQINSSQPELKVTKIQTQYSFMNANKSYIPPFFQKMQKSTQTESINQQATDLKNQIVNKNEDKHCQNMFIRKQINLQKNGFVTNYPNQTKHQKSIRKSSDYYLSAFSRDIINMNKSFIKNKLQQKSSEQKNKKRNSLFARNR